MSSFPIPVKNMTDEINYYFQEVDGVKVLQLETAAGAAIRVMYKQNSYFKILFLVMVNPHLLNTLVLLFLVF